MPFSHCPPSSSSSFVPRSLFSLFPPTPPTMHQGGRGGVVPPPLALAMPRPHLVRTRSGASRSSLASPRTPSCRSPVPSAFFCPGSRKSTDSWGSSVDGDEPEFEWQTDQVLLLSRVSILFSRCLLPLYDVRDAC